MSTGASLTVIAICQIILTAALAVAALALVYAIFAFKSMVNKKIDEAMSRVQPVVDQANSIAQRASETADKVSAKVDAIVTKAEGTASKVGDKVDAVSEKVEAAVSPQVVAAAGFATAAVKIMQIYRDLSKAKEAVAAARKPAPAEQNSENGVEAHI